MNQTHIAKSIFAALALAALFPTASFADDLANTNSPDKSQYNLFNRTPSDLMRPMNSDQDDNVIDAHTLDAGHLQLESSLINYYHFSQRHNFYPGISDHFVEEEYSWGPRLRIGLLNNVELDVTDDYSTRAATYHYSFQPEQTVHSSGFSDVNVGLTINLWGNDGGVTALALHPYVAIPTDHGEVLGGVSAPFTVNLPLGFYFKMENEFYVTESQQFNYGGFYNAVSLHEDLGSQVEGYWYLDSTVTSQSNRQWFGYTGFGFDYNFTRDFQIFAGIGFGLDEAAYDFNPRFGAVFRF